MLAHRFSLVNELAVVPPDPAEKQRILYSKEGSVAQKYVNIEAGSGT